MRFEDFLAQEKARQSKKKGTHKHDEDDLEMSCIKWYDMQYPDKCFLLHHSPNEGRLVGGIKEGARRKRMGVRAGFPDLVLMKARKGYHGLAIELKTPTGTQTKTQKEYQKLLEEEGWLYVIVRSLEEFIKKIKDYDKE